jgi:hypothetical protein
VRGLLSVRCRNQHQHSAFQLPMSDQDSLCQTCYVLFCPNSPLDPAQDGRCVVGGYSRLVTLPGFQDITQATSEGCIFCALILRRLTERTWPTGTREILIGPAILTFESYRQDGLTPEENGVYAVEVSIVANGVPTTSLWFNVFLEAAASGWSVIPMSRRPPHLDRTSLACISQLQEWIKKCTLYHEGCDVNKSSYCPTRLVDVGLPDGSAVLRLIRTSGKETKYVALSHCWGSLDSGSRILKTEISTIEAHMEGIAWERWTPYSASRQNIDTFVDCL